MLGWLKGRGRNEQLEPPPDRDSSTAPGPLVGKCGLVLENGAFIPFNPSEPFHYRAGAGGATSFRLIEVPDVADPDTLDLAAMRAAILAELERQVEAGKPNGLYLYNTDDKETGVDGILDLIGLAKAVLAFRDTEMEALRHDVERHIDIAQMYLSKSERYRAALVAAGIDPDAVA